MSEEYRRIQYVKVTDAALGRAKGKALPVINWELDENDNVVSVEVLTSLPGEQRHTLRLGRHRWRPLYSSEKFILGVTSITSSFYKNLLKFRGKKWTHR